VFEQPQICSHHRGEIDPLNDQLIIGRGMRPAYDEEPIWRMRFAVIGVGIGIVGSRGLARAIQGLLFGVPANDPIAFVSIPVLLSLVALAAESVAYPHADHFA
jgi:hypothetical protein